MRKNYLTCATLISAMSMSTIACDGFRFNNRFAGHAKNL